MCVELMSLKYCSFLYIELSICVAVLWSKAHCICEVLLKCSLLALIHDTVIVAWGCKP